MSPAWALVLALIPPAAYAAEKPAKGEIVTLTLTNGSTVEGKYQGEADGAFWVEFDGGGEAAIETSTIVKMRTSSEYKRKAAALGSADTAGWWKLSQWAAAREEMASARAAASEVIHIDPEHAAARRFLGHEKIDGRWLSGDDLNRSKGLVTFNGEWMTKAAAHEKANEGTRPSSN